MVATPIVSSASHTISLDDWMQNPRDRTEWINGELLEKNGMTGKHGRTQARLATYWTNYKNSTNSGGEVYVETPCRTVGRGRSPDITYLTPELVAQFGDFSVLPQSFSLIAEIISPTDYLEDVFGKVNEYLQSGCQEVWLVIPENRWIVIITPQERLLLTVGEVARTQVVLQGFSLAVDELLA